jgi:hypothetical protein
VLFLTETYPETSPECVSIPTLIEGIDSLWAGNTEVCAMPQLGCLHGAANGKYIVCQCSGGCMIVFSHKVEVQGAEGLVGLSSVREG